MVNFTLRRCRRRKNIAVKVQNSQVVVTAPFHVSESFINTLIAEKESWLKSKIDQQETSKAFANNISLDGQLWFEGNRYPLIVTFDGSGTRFHQQQVWCGLKKRFIDTANVTLTKQLKKQLELWYSDMANNCLPKRVSLLAERVGLRPEKVSIRKYKARWGSCDNQAHIKLNYFLMMLPQWVIDYVLIHELCHLQHLNHSREFWTLVAIHCPEYLQAKRWLKEHQRYLLWPESS